MISLACSISLLLASRRSRRLSKPHFDQSATKEPRIPEKRPATAGGECCIAEKKLKWPFRHFLDVQ